MQSLFSELRRFIDIGYYYFSCAFGLIFIYSLLPLFLVGLSQF